MSRIQSYPLEVNEDKLWYRFVSKGECGDIVKLVNYEYFDDKLWNLAFGDANNDETDFDDKSVSDNGDMRKVIRTIFETGLIFTEAYSDRSILIIPVDRQRELLYNRIFKDKQEEIEAFFSIKGASVNLSESEEYMPTNIYGAFILARKKQIF